MNHYPDILREIKNFIDRLPTINASNFEDIVFSAFDFQYKSNHLYRSYAQALGKVPAKVDSVDQIPFLPIRFFKNHPVISGIWNEHTRFTSSSTSGTGISTHAVPDLGFYLNNARAIFERFYGATSSYHFLALLPSYAERHGSSLIAMIDHFIADDESGHSGYYLQNHEQLIKKIQLLSTSFKRTIVWGVSFALLDLAEKYEVDLSNCIVMETGGMKGRRKEWVRAELHNYLCQRFNTVEIHSEYGMTELLSQAYSKGRGYFQCPPWMKVIVRDINDPFSRVQDGKIGAINVIDLANIHSSAFIETEDLGRVNGPGFEVLGRMDNSDVRGCNLMVG